MRFNILAKGLVIVALPLLCQVGFSYFYSTLISDAQLTLKKQSNFQEISTLAEEMNVEIQKALTYSIIAGFDPTEENKEKHRRYIKASLQTWLKIKSVLQVPLVKEALQYDIDDKMESIETTEAVKRLLFALTMLRTRAIDPNLTIPEAFRNGGIPGDMMLSNLSKKEREGSRAIDIVNKASARLVKEEEAFDRKSKEIDRLANQILLVNAGLGLALSALFFYDISRRILRVRKNIKLLSENKTPEMPTVGTDEIADLDTSVHACAEELIRLEGFKKQMVGVVSHEMKAPLASVHGIMSLFSSGAYGVLSEKAQEHCHRGERNLARLIRLVNDLLALEQMEGEEFKLNPAPIKISELIRDSFSAVESLAVQKNLNLEFAGEDREDTEIHADGQRLTQVLINLLSNAIKFSDQETNLQVTSRKLEGERIEISIQNTGREIPAEKRASLFQRFAQVEASDGTKKGGSGLGLTIAKTIVEQHGGEIDFESEEGKTRFWFVIPIQMKSKPATTTGVISTSESQSKMRFGLLQKGLILVGLPLMVNVIFLFGLKYDWQRVESSLARTKEVSACSTQQFLTAGSTLNLFWISALGSDITDPELRKFVSRQAEEATNNLEQLKFMASKQKNGKDILAVYEQLKKNRAEVDKLSKDQPTARQLASSGFFDRCIATMDFSARVSGKNEKVIKKEEKIQQATIERMRAILLGVPAANIMLSWLLALFYSKGIRNRLLNVRINAGCLVRKQPLLKPLSGNDEIADLDKYFHEVGTQIMRLDQFKEQMIGVASHELRSPLSSLVMSITMLESGVLGDVSEKARSRLLMAEDESNRLIRLINNLLDFEKLQAGKLDLALQNEETEEILNNAINSIKHLADTAGLNIIIKTDAHQLRCDPDRVVQVLVNILSNAIKYSPRGGEIVLSAEAKENQIVLSIADQGKGISEERRERLFNRFQKMEAEDYELGGTGLGLSISKWLVELHGGDIAVESEEGKGTIFHCKFPMAAEK